MLQAEELQKANIIKNSQGTLCRVTDLVQREGVNQISTTCNPLKRFGERIEEFEEVPLSHEVLKDVLGLISSTHRWVDGSLSQNMYFIGNDYFVQKINSEEYTFGKREVNSPMKISDVKYLHQLQNEYKRVTGEDLQVDV